VDPDPTRGSRLIPPLVAVAAGIALAAIAIVSGSLADTHDTLVIMGFDPDRAQLLTALVGGALAAAAATLVAGRRWIATATGSLVALALFAATFGTETSAALASSGAQGTFDPMGWALSLLTIVVAAVISSWATAVVCAELRRAVAAAGQAGVVAARARSLRVPGAWRPAVGLAVALVVAVAVPVFGDMVNYAPDVHMRAGAPALVSLGGAASASGVPPDGFGPAGASTGAVVAGGGTTVGGSPDGLLPAVTSDSGSVSAATPWLAWRPSGGGTLVSDVMTAPWSSGPRHIRLDVYLPAGYQQSPTRRYPVVYEVPWNAANWDKAIGITGMLDTLIASGSIPPSIVVFGSHYGAPMPDTECVDSADGQQQLETYFSQTVVEHVDATYRTIATPAARALFGYSEGGYCASMLLLRHPDVFGQAIVMSGYFQAGIRTNVTTNAPLPFGNDAAMIADHSPLQLASTLPAAVRSRLYLVLSADPREWFYGPQYAAFSAVLQKEGYHYLLLPTSLGHAWMATRLTLPIALRAVAARWVTLGVFAA
jgi:enterochelin esterase-like enzyme